MIAARPRFADRHPAAYLTLMYVLMILVFIAAGAAAAIGNLGVQAQLLIGDGALALIALAAVARGAWWQEAGLTLPQTGSRAWLLCWLPFLAALRPLLDGIVGVAPAELLLLTVMAFLVGFVEETFFRGIFMRVLQPAGRTAMILWPTLLFGVTHALNLLAGKFGAETLLQIGYALALGFLYAVLRLRMGSIWPLIAAHAATDFLVWLCAGGVGVATPTVTAAMLVLPAIFTVAFPVYGIWLLRTEKRFGIPARSQRRL